MKDNGRSIVFQSLTVAAAYTAYNVGSGFATGTEVVQFFGSWGGMLPFVVFGIALLCTIVLNYILYNVGFSVPMEKSSDFYYYFCGKYVGKFFDIYAYLALAGWVVVMISGSGATINTYFEMPQYVGTVFMGILCSLAVCLGLHKLIDILGSIGVVILFSTICLGIYTVATADQSLLEASKNVTTYVQEGQILQPTVFGMINPILSALSYAGVLMFGCAAWVVASGKLMKSKKQMAVTSVLSSLCYFVPLLAVIFTILLNMDFVAGEQIPMLAVVKNVAPALAFPYSILIIAAIFTTASGMLFVLVSRFSEEKTKRFYTIAIGVVVFSVVVGSFVPFATILNVVYSLMGMSGMVFGVFIIGKFIRVKLSKTEA